jgi:hypothetical protein
MISSVGTLFNFGDLTFFPPIRDIIDVLSRSFLVGVATVSAIIGSTGCGAVVDVKSL